MNIADLIQSYFDGDNAQRLGQAVGIDGNLAQKALSIGLPMQVNALADHAANPQGQAQIMEAISSLPQFGSISDVLGSADGAGNLQRAGELLAPALLGGQSDTIVNAVTSQVGGSVGGMQKLMQMALPLLLSLLGRQGVNAGSLGSVLGGLKNMGGNLGNMAGVAAGAAGLAGAAQAAGVNLPGAGGAGAVNAILDLLKGQFSGANADKIGSAAGFTGSTAGRAVQGAWPVVLNALVNKGKTDAGAGELQRMMGQFGNLTDGNGHLNAGMLGDAAEMSRVETQGRGLLGGLFGNVDELTGRLGTALGGSGNNAGRLLSLLTPLLLSLLGKKTTGMNGAALSGLLGGLGGNLSSLLPAGLSGLGALLGSQTVAAQPDVTVVTPATPAARVVETATPTPRPVTPPPPATTVTTATTEKRGGFPWWWILLPLLLLGGCLLTRRPAPAPVAAAGCENIIVENPVSNANLPAEDFTMSGKAPANSTVKVLDQGQEVATATADANCNWTAPIPAPTVGAHTYSLEGVDNNLKSEFQVNVADGADAVDTNAQGNVSASSVLVTNPTSGSNLPPEPFTMSGTGPAGTSLRIEDQGQEVATATIGDDGTWTAELPAPTVGEHTYSVIGGEGVRSEFSVDVVEGATGTDATGTTDTSGTDTTDMDTAAAPVAGTFAISEPMADATLPAGGFDLRGTGTPGEEVEVFEDGTSLGKTTIGDDGNWTYRVASPAAGAHTYSVKGPDGMDLGTVATTVEAATGDASACTNDYTLSITDGQTVSEPFRFGGEGQGQGYSVTVKRGDRTIGTKDIPLDGACGWSYTSKPGAGDITYEVRPMGDAAAEPLSTVNLTVGN